MVVSVLLELHLREDAIASGGAVVSEVLAKTRSFAGNLGIEVLEDWADPAHLLAIARWDSPEHEAAYRAWRATPEGASPLSTVLDSPPKLSRFLPTDI